MMVAHGPIEPGSLAAKLRMLERRIQRDLVLWIVREIEREIKPSNRRARLIATLMARVTDQDWVP